MDRKGVVMLIGFIVFVFGMVSLLLLLVGIRLSFLVWIDYWGMPAGLVIRLSMIIGGIIAAYLASQSDEADSEE